MRKALIISVVGIALTSAAWGQTEEQARAQLAQGVAALDRLNAAGVAKPLRDCLRIDPSEDGCVQELKRFFHECVNLEIDEQTCLLAKAMVTVAAAQNLKLGD